VASKSRQKEFSPIWLQCSHSVFAHNKISSDTSLETKWFNELLFGQFDILKSFPFERTFLIARMYFRDFYSKNPLVVSSHIMNQNTISSHLNSSCINGVTQNLKASSQVFWLE
jgi:hypothetical protein